MYEALMGKVVKTDIYLVFAGNKNKVKLFGDYLFL